MGKPRGRSVERREFARFKTFSILEVVRANTREPIENDPKLVDMSEGGLCFYSNGPLKKGERIRVNIGIPGFNSSVSAYARVIWAQSSTEHSGANFTGVEFVGMKESDREMIRRLEKAGRLKKR